MWESVCDVCGAEAVATYGAMGPRGDVDMAVCEMHRGEALVRVSAVAGVPPIEPGAGHFCPYC